MTLKGVDKNLGKRMPSTWIVCGNGSCREEYKGVAMIKRTNKINWIASAFAVAGLVVGYSIGNDALANKSDKSAKVTPAHTIADARCDQEERCGNIGSGKEYKNRAECLGKISGVIAKNLNNANCPAGYDQKELDECLNEVRSESCGNPFDTLERIVSCRSSSICRTK
jgi:hypothetical protein